ncbi:unnamed protein product [Diamesa serratosioi]
MKLLIVLCVLINLVVDGSVILQHESGTREKREWFIFRDSTTVKPTTTTIRTHFPGNDLSIGECRTDDKIIYVDETKVDPDGVKSTISGVLEIYIDSIYFITCVKVIDQVINGTGAIPTLDSGGLNEKFVKVAVQGKYGHGFHFKITIKGSLKKITDDV